MHFEYEEDEKNWRARIGEYDARKYDVRKDDDKQPVRKIDPPKQIIRIQDVKTFKQLLVTVLYLYYIGVCLCGSSTTQDSCEHGDSGVVNSETGQEDIVNSRMNADLSITRTSTTESVYAASMKELHHYAAFNAIMSDDLSSVTKTEHHRGSAKKSMQVSENPACFFAQKKLTALIQTDQSLTDHISYLLASDDRKKRIKGNTLDAQVRKARSQVETILKKYLEPVVLQRFITTNLQIIVVDGDYIRTTLGIENMDACYISAYHRMYVTLHVFKKLWRTQDVEAILNEIDHASYTAANIEKLRLNDQQRESFTLLALPFLDHNGQIDIAKAEQLEIALREASNNFKLFSELYQTELHGGEIPEQHKTLFNEMKGVVLSEYYPRKHRVNVKWLKQYQTRGLLETHTLHDKTIYKLNRLDVDQYIPADMWIEEKDLNSNNVATYYSYVPDNSSESKMKALGYDWLHTMSSYQSNVGGAYGKLSTINKLAELSSDLASYGSRPFLKVFAPLWLDYRQKYLGIIEGSYEECVFTK